MRKRNIRTRFDARPAELMAAYMEDRDGELLDAVITAAALVAGADGWIAPAERRQLFDFLRRQGLLSVATRAEILDAFETRTRELEERRGAELVVDSLRRLAGRSPSRLVIDVGREIAAADCRVDPREQHMLQLIRVILGGPPPISTCHPS